MSKLKLWKPFSLFIVLLLMSALVVVPATPVQANLSSITVNPYDTRIISANTGYRITMTTGASLNAGNTITIEFPSDTNVSGADGQTANVFVQDTPCTTPVTVSAQQVTVTVPAIAIVPGQQFTVTFNQSCNITNPTTSGLKTVTVWTTKEPIHVTSGPYEITAVKVYTGPTAHSENATITGAIAAASPDDIIIVPDGTYNAASGESFPLVLDKAVTIKSLSGASATRIEPTSDNLSGFNVTAAGATIGGSNSGFTIMPGGRGGIYADETGGNGITVQDCIFKSDTAGERRGMWFENLSNDALITGNSFATPMLGTGIQVINADGATISNNTVTAGTLKYCFLTFKAEAFYPGRGLPLSPYSEYVAETPSTINDVSVTGNSVAALGAAGRAAILFGASTKPCDHGCPQAQDLAVGTGGVTISGNTFANTNNGAGVAIDADEDGDTCGACIPTDATAHITGVENIHINNNSFSGHLFAVYNQQPTAVDAKHNYWGHASGPSHLSPVAYGDNVTANVTFQPWLVNTSTGAPPASEIQIDTTSPLPDGTTGVDYPTPLSASGGTGPYTWAYYSAPATRPPGLSIVGNSFSGLPTEVNTFNFAVQVSDGAQATYKDFTMQVYGGNLVITTTSPLPGGTINVPYGPVQLQAVGGTGSYEWSLNVGSDLLPTGLTLGVSDGKISGTPTAAGTFNFRVKVTCGILAPGLKDLSITISGPSGSDQKLIGADDAAGSNGSADIFRLTKFTAEASDNMTQFRVKSGASGNVKVAIYEDNAGSPDALITAMNTGQAVTAGSWNTLNFDSTDIDAGTDYWLAEIYDTPGAVQYVSGGGTMRYRVSAYGGFTFPDPATGDGALSSFSGYELSAGWATAVPSAPTVTNSTGHSDVTETSARLNGEITDTGGENPTAIIYWGDNDGIEDPYAWDNSENLGTKGAGAFGTDIAALTPAKLYYYRCFASNSGETAWADSSDNFTTDVLSAPTVTNSTGASAVTATSARLNGEITDTGGENPSAIIYWGDNDGITNLYNWDNSVNKGTQSGTFSTDITDLNLGTKYYYRCFASNIAGSAWSDNTSTFNTLSGGVAQKLIGADDAAGSTSSAGIFRLTKFTAEASGSMTEFRVKSGTSGNVKVAIYQDNAGSPGALITAMNTGQAVTAGDWNTLNFDATGIDVGTDYWLAEIYDTAGAVQYVSGGTMKYRVSAYGGFTFPDPATGLGALSSFSGYELSAGWATAVSTPPDSPTLVTPKTTITFEWSAASGATKYRLQVNTASDFTGTSMFDAEVSATSQDVALSVGTTYYWRVKARNTGGWSGWSATGSVSP